MSLHDIFKRSKKQEEKVNPAVYFGMIKNKKRETTDDELLKYFDNCQTLIEKYSITGQERAIKKLLFHMECIEKERELIKMGINKFVYCEDIEEYIANVADKAVKIIELSRYERDIPDEYLELIGKCRGIFSDLYVLFTDYTGKVEKNVAKEKREKDPIIFGVFQDGDTSALVDRFYYICDWEDEYCDLTLDKMVNKMKCKKDIDIIRNIDTPSTIERLKEQLGMLKSDNKNNDRDYFF